MKLKPKETFDPIAGVIVDEYGKPVVKKKGPRPRGVIKEGFELDLRSVFEKDHSVIGAVVSKDADGFLTEYAGRKRLTVRPRKTYRRGTRWRVVGENVRIEAMCHYGSGANGGAIWSGFSRILPVGTVLECIGWRRFRRDGLVAPQFIYSSLPEEAKWSTIWPLDGIWRPWPLDGILEVTGDEA